MVRLFEKTNYTKIFKNSYWGWFEYTDEFFTIIENRDMFIENYDIKSYQKRTNKTNEFIRKETKLLQVLRLDHTETYKTKTNSIIVITSPYKHINISDYESNGWIQINPLYCNDAITFMKYI